MRTARVFLDRLSELEEPFRPFKEPKHRPSSLGSECYRRIMYQFRGVEQPPFPAKVGRIFALGHHVEEIVLDLVRKANLGTLLQYLDPVTMLPPDTHGKPDPQFVVRSKEMRIPLAKIDAVVLEHDGGLRIYEVKSINARQFKELKGPKSDHLTQGSIYFRLFQECRARGDYDHLPDLPKKAPVRGVRFVYLCKDDCELKAYDADPDDLDDRFDRKVYPKVMIVNEMSDADQLPPSKKTQDCRWCPFATQCARNELPPVPGS